MSRVLRVSLVAAAMVVAGRAPALAQEPRSAVAADTIRVGEVVPVAVRVTVEPGQRVVWPDTLPLAGELVENAARVRERVDTLDGGRLQVTGIYSVTPWRPGEVPLGQLRIGLLDGREVVDTLTASLPSLDVISVLPEDTAGLEPRPAKGVIGASWSWWRILLILLLVLALVLAGIWWLRRRSDGQEALPLEPAVPPRERVLARLREAREAGLLERGATKEFYTRVSAALREYLAALHPEWGEDRTTTELLGRVRSVASPSDAADLAEVLRPVDQVKFARRVPDRETAHDEWEAARDWVLGFAWPPPRAADEHGEAA